MALSPNKLWFYARDSWANVVIVTPWYFCAFYSSSNMIEMKICNENCFWNATACWSGSNACASRSRPNRYRLFINLLKNIRFFTIDREPRLSGSRSLLNTSRCNRVSGVSYHNVVIVQCAETESVRGRGSRIQFPLLIMFLYSVLPLIKITSFLV